MEILNNVVIMNTVGLLGAVALHGAAHQRPHVHQFPPLSPTIWKGICFMVFSVFWGDLIPPAFRLRDAIEIFILSLIWI